MQQAVQQMALQQPPVQEPVNKNIDLSPPMSSSVQQLAGQGNGMQLPLSQQGNYAAF